MRKIIKWILLAFAAMAGLFLLIQLFPVGQDNPPAVNQVQWDSPQTQALFERSCADCHSNQTVWPWYSKIAPVSWLVKHDVDEGREKFNIEDLQGMNSRRLKELPEEIDEAVGEGEMPMSIYVLMHPSARLSREEEQALVDGLQKTLSNTLSAR